MTQQLTLNVGLSDRACFDNFFKAGNAETVEAVSDLVDDAGGLLVLCGNAGSGKTHLLYAAQKAALAADRRASYLSLSDQDVLGRLDGFDDLGALVCADNVDEAAGKDWSERLLLNVFEHMRQTGGGMLLACEKPPSECGFLMADLVSRLNSGALFHLKPLTEHDKSAAMRLRAEQRGFNLPEDVIAYVMKRYPRDTSALFALLDRIDRYSLSEQRRVTIPLIRKLDQPAPG